MILITIPYTRHGPSGLTGLLSSPIPSPYTHHDPSGLTGLCVSSNESYMCAVTMCAVAMCAVAMCAVAMCAVTMCAVCVPIILDLIEVRTW